MPVTYVELTPAEKKKRSKKLPEVRRAWKESGFEAVTRHFRDDQNLKFVGKMVSALMHLETTIIDELLGIDGEVTEEDISSCVFENVMRWNEEHLRAMARMLIASGDRALEVFDQIFDPEVE
jgi:hypothetical protein